MASGVTDTRFESFAGIFSSKSSSLSQLRALFEISVSASDSLSSVFLINYITKTVLCQL